VSGDLILPIAYGDFAIFADLHLQASASDEINSFVAQIEELDEKKCLVVLGDLFDAWTGPGDFQLGGFAILEKAIADFVAKGGRAILVRGNRDVLFSASDGAKAKLEVCDGILLGESKANTLLLHGDQFCTRDRGYQFLRRCLRFGPLRGLLRSLPISLRHKLAAKMRQGSQSAVSRKPLDHLALVEHEVEDLAINYSAKQVFIGHLHQADERKLVGGISLTVLPAWEKHASPHFLTV